MKYYLDKFIAFKTPLDDRYKEKIGLAHRWTCSMLVTALQREQVSNNLSLNIIPMRIYYLEKSRSCH